MKLRSLVPFGALVLVVSGARADESGMPPWSERAEVPPPSWAKTVVPHRAEVPVYTTPGYGHSTSAAAPLVRRGTLTPFARVPFFGSMRGPHCPGRWYNIGALAWVCSDDVEFSPEPRSPSLLPAPGGDGLPYRYYFVGPEGATAYPTFEHAGDEAPDQTLEKGWSLPIVEQRRKGNDIWGRSRAGKWINMAELGLSRPLAFHGAELSEGRIDVGWVTADSAPTFTAPRVGKRGSEKLPRFFQVHIYEERREAGVSFYRISEAEGEAAPSAKWVQSTHIARPTLASPPPEVSGAAFGERWIDVELTSQTLTAYEGRTPVFATLVSTGKGARGTDTATPPGIHRIWVKLFTTPMDNLEKPDVEHYYSIEDVPYVQFFDKGVALHAAFWHRNLGRVQSHGCVNLAPLDAERLFRFTAPHLPNGWDAALPTALEPGTWVRVH